MPAPAAASIAFAASPSKLEITGKPGSTFTRSIGVYNREDKPIKVRAYVMDYHIKSDNSFIFSPPGHETYSAANWIELKKTKILLPKKKSKEKVLVPFTLNIPTSAEAGGHYAVVFLESAAKENEGSIKGRIGCLILVTVTGKVSRRGGIDDLDITKTFFNRSIENKVVFENQGNVHLTTKGEVLFFDRRGNRVGKEKLEEITALPKTKRLMLATWENPPWYGRYKAVANVYYGADLNTFNIKKTTEKSFYIIPWLPISTMFGVLLLSLFLRYRRIRKAPETDVVVSQRKEEEQEEQEKEQELINN